MPKNDISDVERRPAQERNGALRRSRAGAGLLYGRAYSQAFAQTPLMTRVLKESRETPSAESFFLHKQMMLQTPMIVVLEDGERVEGVLEWYDCNSMKLRGRQGTRVIIYKHAIKYLYKAEEK
jgi:sRNA-binding regulator protein Hfq